MFAVVVERVRCCVGLVLIHGQGVKGVSRNDDRHDEKFVEQVWRSPVRRLSSKSVCVRIVLEKSSPRSMAA